MKKITSQDILAMRGLLTTTADYLLHADVREDVVAADLLKIRNHLELQRGRSLSRIDYREIAPFIQKVADLLSSPKLSSIRFSLPSTALAARLREAIAELKKYTRFN